MKYKNAAAYCVFLVILAVSVYLTWRGFESIAIANQYAAQITTLQTPQVKNERDVKYLLALDLADQARSINIEGNSNQMTAVLLAVQSMKMSPTIEAAQVLQSNLQSRVIAVFPHNSASSPAFSPDGKLVVTGGFDHLATVWEIASGKEIAHVKHNDAIVVAFSLNGNVASASADGVIQVWDAETGHVITRLKDIFYYPAFVAFSPNGKYLLSSGILYPRIWDISTGKEIAHLPHDEGYVTSIVFSPDNKHIITGSSGNIARVWDFTTGREVARVTHSKPVTTVAFSPDGKMALSGSEDGSVYIWDSLTGGNIVPGFSYGPSKNICTASVASVAFSPDGKYIAVGCKTTSPIPSYPYNPNDENVTIRVWQKSIDNYNEYTFMYKILYAGAVNSLVFSPNSKYLLTGGEDHTARMWEVVSGREVSRVTHGDVVTSVIFSPNGKQAISRSADETGTIRVWDVTSWREDIHGRNTGFVSNMAFSPDGKYIVSGGRDGVILIQEVETGKEVVKMKLGGKNPSQDTTANPRIYWMSQSDVNIVNSIAFSPDGKYVVSGSADNTVRIWDVITGKEVARMLPDYLISTQNTTIYYSGVYHVAFSPNGKYIASSGVDGNIYIWEVSSRKEIARLTPLLKHDSSPYLNYNALSIAFSPDSKYVVSGSTDKTIRVWEIKTQREIASFGIFENDLSVPFGVTSVAFSPDGRYIVWGGGTTVHVWDTVEKKEVLAMKHDHVSYSMEEGRYSVEDGWKSSLGTVTSVTYSSDGKYILSGSADNTARIWDAVTGQEISRIVHNQGFTSSGGVYSVVMSPDGKYVASVDSYGQINLWLWRPDDLIADACSRLPRNLTRMEWQLYIRDMIPYQAVCPNLPVDKAQQ